MKRYTNINYVLYEGHCNHQNYLILHDLINCKGVVFNWYLSKKEVTKIIKVFTSDGISEKDFYECNWRNIDDIMATMHSIKILA